MTLKRLVLGVLTLLVVALVGRSLVSSWNEPQITSRLQLYQTDLLLHASEWQGGEIANDSDPNVTTIRTSLLGADPIESAIEQYQEVRQSAQTNLEKSQSQLEQLTALPQSSEFQPNLAATTRASRSSQEQQLKAAISQLTPLVDELDLRLGILQAQQNDVAAAIASWDRLGNLSTSSTTASLNQTAAVLTGLWSEPPRLLPNAEQQIQKDLEGWFRYRALTRLYELQQRQDALAALQASEQETAQQTLVKLAVVGVMPTLGLLLGTGLLIFLIAQRLLKGKQSLLAHNSDLTWSVPWDWEVVWQVLIVGFFFVGQVVLPLVLGSLGVSFANFSNRARAFYSLFYYGLMATGGLSVLYLSIKQFFPLPEGWFRFKWQGNWFWWGLGGYFVALPLMIVVSLINQQLWQEQGGSNPLLPLVLEERDGVALATFLFTAAVAAPLFEETLFRGFLLPSLNRYFPTWGAIALSSFLFAIAHLSLSEVLPLTVLGAVLGFVYTRSRNLLAPMLLHCLWNSITMLGLFLLGSSSA